MGQVSHEQADMLLKLYELRREPRLREARDWFFRNFHHQSLSERASLTPEQDASVRMVTSYWEMVAGLVKRGLVDEDLFFENTAEFWIVWDRLKPISSEVRHMTKDPHIWENLEKLAVRYEIWRERRAPGAIAAMRELMQRAQAAQVGEK
jgi:Domain of unknown function (DUF4760)